ncbi:MAG: manganese efflux pump [Oscillospiraceae bacterium]|nr:manganese efflux pump [Oscillospiraceae bacterium]
MAILSGLIVSIDAFFIGISLGLQKKFKFSYLVFINAFLLILCMAGFFIAGRIYEHIPFSPDLIVGVTFITLGIWYIASYFAKSAFKKQTAEKSKEITSSAKTFVLIGLVMSFEAMLITTGVTLTFGESSTIAIPLTIGLAHFAYSALSFYLSRIRRVRRIPAVWSNVVSGLSLIVYGSLALL